METLLADALRAVREELLRAESEAEALHDLALVLRDVGLGWASLSEEVRSAVHLALQSALPLNA
ncbi:MAG: hypothetical protein ACK4UU_05225, partial [Fimbriimonadales bacterium]